MAACALVIAGMGGFAALRILSIDNHAHATATNWLPSLDKAAHASENVQVFRHFMLRHSIVTDAAGKQDAEESLRDLAKKIDRFSSTTVSC